MTAHRTGGTEPSGPPVVVAVIVRRGQVLLGRRGNPEDDLVWQFPGGKLEPGETVEAAIAREVQEETGLMVTGAALIGSRIHPQTGRHISYLACATVGEPQPTIELPELTWCTMHDLSVLVPAGIYPPVRRHLEALIEPGGQ